MDQQKREETSTQIHEVTNLQIQEDEDERKESRKEKEGEERTEQDPTVPYSVLLSSFI